MREIQGTNLEKNNMHNENCDKQNLILKQCYRTILLCSLVGITFTLMLFITNIVHTKGYITVQATYEGISEYVGEHDKLRTENFIFELNDEVYSVYRTSPIIRTYKEGDIVDIRCNPFNPVEVEEVCLIQYYSLLFAAFFVGIFISELYLRKEEDPTKLVFSEE